MKFQDLAGQRKAVEGLLALYHTRKIPHALMIVGKEGTGSLPLALAFVQFLFCTEKKGNDACGRCAACLKVQKLAHPDFHLSFPTIPPKAGAKTFSSNFLNEFREFVAQSPYQSTFHWLQTIDAQNKQGNISADECREIIDQLNRTAFEGGWKVQLIWRPEFLGKEGNILLKLIEEPPPNTLILFVAENPENILQTILSRVQTVQLQPLSREEIAQALQANHPIDSRRARQIAELSENSYAKALELTQFVGNDLFEPLRNWFNAVFTNNSVLMNQWVDEQAEGGREQQKNMLLYIQQILSHALRKTVAPSYEPPLLPEEIDFVHKLAKQKLDITVFKSLTEILSKTIYHIQRNANSKIQLFFLCLQVPYLLKGKELK